MCHVQRVHANTRVSCPLPIMSCANHVVMYNWTMTCMSWYIYLCMYVILYGIRLVVPSLT